MNLLPSIRYLAQRIAELEAGMAMAMDQAAAKDARIAELEKGRRKPRAAKPLPPGS